MFRFGTPSQVELDDRLTAARAASPSFDRPGATKSSTSIAGFRFDTYRGRVGSGEADWTRAKDGLREWAAHAGANLAVVPPNADLANDQTVVLYGPVVGPLQVIIPCRISYVVDEPTRFGFAYITLPGHPECGEEAFMLSRDEAAVVFTMSSYSRPAELLSRLGGPVSRVIQRRTNDAYIDGMRRFISS
jgi:uncharacterized protein (UPF0548 family)